MTKGLGACISVALFLGMGCSTPGAEPTPSAAQRPQADETPALRVETRHGGPLLPPHIPPSRVADFVLYPDGTVYVPVERAPLALAVLEPQVQVRRLTGDGIDAILSEADKIDLLGPQADYGTPLSTEGPTITTFQLHTGGRSFTQSVPFVDAASNALEFEQQPPPEVLQRRQATKDFYGKLFDLESWLPVGSVGEASPAEFERFSVFYIQSSGSALHRSLEWPHSALPAPPSRFPAVGCLELTKAQVDALSEIARRGGDPTRVVWQSQGSSHEVSVRPVFPGETACRNV
jgi:hypothetical protein